MLLKMFIRKKNDTRKYSRLLLRRIKEQTEPRPPASVNIPKFVAALFLSIIPEYKTFPVLMGFVFASVLYDKFIFQY